MLLRQTPEWRRAASRQISRPIGHEITVRMPAAVSLLRLGEKSAESYILEWLISSREWEIRAILEQLDRVERSRLEFAMQRIEAIASDNRRDEYTRRAARKILEKGN